MSSPGDTHISRLHFYVNPETMTIHSLYTVDGNLKVVSFSIPTKLLLTTNVFGIHTLTCNPRIRCIRVEEKREVLSWSSDSGIEYIYALKEIKENPPTYTIASSCGYTFSRGIRIDFPCRNGIWALHICCVRSGTKSKVLISGITGQEEEYL